MRTLDANFLRSRMEIARRNYNTAKKFYQQSKYHTKQNAQIVADAKREYEIARAAYLTVNMSLFERHI